MPSNLERKARRKKQTRLVFEPSGPAVGTLSPAKVRYSLRGENGKKPAPTAPVVIKESDDELAVVVPKAKARKGPDVLIGMH